MNRMLNMIIRMVVLQFVRKGVNFAIKKGSAGVTNLGRKGNGAVENHEITGRPRRRAARQMPAEAAPQPSGARAPQQASAAPIDDYHEDEFEFDGEIPTATRADGVDGAIYDADGMLIRKATPKPGG